MRAFEFSPFAKRVMAADSFAMRQNIDEIRDSVYQQWKVVMDQFPREEWYGYNPLNPRQRIEFTDQDHINSVIKRNISYEGLVIFKGVGLQTIIMEDDYIFRLVCKTEDAESIVGSNRVGEFMDISNMIIETDLLDF